MAKVSLADRLAGQLTDTEPEVPVAPVTVLAPATAVAGAERPVAEPAPAPTSRRPRKRAQAAPEPPPAPEEPTLPRYLTLERVEGRLRLDQLDDLSALTRRLNRARGRGVGERITNNTLLRVACDWLLANSDTLAGADEAGLRRSLGLPDLQSPVDTGR